MVPRLRSASKERAFLLIEASLTAVVIAVGLVFISRGISSSLAALARIRKTDAAIRFAESVLNETKMKSRFMKKLDSKGAYLNEGAYDMQAEISDEVPDLSEYGVESDDFRLVTVTVYDGDKKKVMARLSELWPSTWLK